MKKGRPNTPADRTACSPGPVCEQLHRMGRSPEPDSHAQRIKHMQLTELDQKDVETLHAAKLAAQQLYIPGLQEVGASIRTISGATFSAIHFEASSDFASVCGEVAAMACMIAAGHRDLEAIAAVWRDGNGDFYLLPPCGRCRELIYDLNASTWVIVSSRSDHWHKSAIEHPAKVPIKELLPMKSHALPYLREEER